MKIEKPEEEDSDCSDGEDDVKDEQKIDKVKHWSRNKYLTCNSEESDSGDDDFDDNYENSDDGSNEDHDYDESNEEVEVEVENLRQKKEESTNISRKFYLCFNNYSISKYP